MRTIMYINLRKTIANVVSCATYNPLGMPPPRTTRERYGAVNNIIPLQPERNRFASLRRPDLDPLPDGCNLLLMLPTLIHITLHF